MIHLCKGCLLLNLIPIELLLLFLEGFCLSLIKNKGCAWCTAISLWSLLFDPIHSDINVFSCSFRHEINATNPKVCCRARVFVGFLLSFLWRMCLRRDIKTRLQYLKTRAQQGQICPGQFRMVCNVVQTPTPGKHQARRVKYWKWDYLKLTLPSPQRRHC